MTDHVISQAMIPGDLVNPCCSTTSHLFVTGLQTGVVAPWTFLGFF